MVTKLTQPGKRVLQTALEASKARRAYTASLQQAKAEGKAIIGDAGLFPRELRHAMSVPVEIIVQFAITLSAKQLSGHYCEIAEQQSFSRDICAAHLTLIGCMANQETDTYVESTFIDPDLVVGSNFPCISVSKSFLDWKSRFNSPYYFVDIPINTWGKDVDDYAVEYCVAQFEELISYMSKYGYKMDPDKLKRTVELSRQLMVLWREIEEYRMVTPSPMGAVDGLTCIGYPLIVLPGTELGVELFTRLRDEVKYRSENKLGIIDHEKLRLLLVGVPPLYNMGLLNYPEQYGAVIVKTEIEYVGGGLINPDILDPDRPLESLARKTLVDFTNPCFGNRIDLVLQTVKDYKIDGIIALNKRGCRNLPSGLRLIKDAVYNETGVPTTIFDLDGIDPRDYNDVRVKTSIDSFIETLLSQKGRD